MIRLDATTRKLQIILGGAVTTNQLPVTVCYSDKSTAGYTGGAQLSNTNSGTAVDILNAPAAGAVRDLDYLSVRNSDTVAATATIRYNDNATLYTIVSVVLQPSDVLAYTHASGWQVTNSSGSVKIVPSATTVDVTDDTTTNATMYPLWVTANSGSLPVKLSSTKLTWNPSTGVWTGPAIVATTSATSPLVLGGTAAGSTLTLQSTSGVGTTDSVLVKVGNNGATTAATFDHNGMQGAVGGTTPAAGAFTTLSTTSTASFGGEVSAAKADSIGSLISARFNASNQKIGFNVANANGFAYLAWNANTGVGTDGATYDVNAQAAASIKANAGTGAITLSIAGAGTAGAPITWSDIGTFSSTGLAITGVLSSSGAYTQTSAEANVALTTTGQKSYSLISGGGGNLAAGYFAIRNNTNGNNPFYIAPDAAGNAVFINSTGAAVTGALSATGTVIAGAVGTYALAAYPSFTDNTGWNVANSSCYFGKNTTSGRSINAAGTINASGADYAEYERNNGLEIPKGAIVGFKADGTLTLTFAEAARFGVKSTNPSYVGGDIWGSEDQVGKRPEPPMHEVPEYRGSPDPGPVPSAPTLILPEEPVQQPEESEAVYAVRYAWWQEYCARAEAAFAAAETVHAASLAEWDEASARFAADRQAYAAELAAAEAAHIDAMVAYQAAVTGFEARLEAARVLVDRIAYSGKVPVNVTGASPGDYIVATAAPDGSLTGHPVANPTFEQYRLAVGRVNRILPDGRAEVAVIVH